MTRDDLILSLAWQVGCIASALLRRLPSSVLKADLVAEGWLGAIHAVDRWDSERGKLSTFAERRIRGAMFDYLRSLDLMSRDARRAFNIESRRAESVGGAPPLRPSLIPIDSCAAWQAAGGREFEDAALRIDAEAIVRRSHLSPRELLMVRNYYLGSATLKEIALSLGIGQPRASQIKKRAVEKMRAAA